MIKAYERAASRLLVGQPSPKPFGVMVGNRFITGTQSLHRTRQSRLWRTFWRLKYNRLNQP